MTYGGFVPGSSNDPRREEFRARVEDVYQRRVREGGAGHVCAPDHEVVVGESQRMDQRDPTMGVDDPRPVRGWVCRCGLPVSPPPR